MKRINFYLLLFFSLIFITKNLAQSSSCNLDFEWGDASTWILGNGTRIGPDVSPIDYFLDDIPDPFYHEVTILDSDIMIPSLPTVGEGDHSLKLGDYFGPDAKISVAINKFLVTECNMSYSFSYALVLQDSPHIDELDDAFFEYKIKDSSGDIIDDLFVYADIEDAYFDLIDGNYCVKYWTTVTVDLSAYVGEMVDVFFMTADCPHFYHEAVAYIDLKCIQNGTHEIDGNTYCVGSSFLLPDPDNSGVWSGPFVINNPFNDYFVPTTPGTYTLVFCSDDGCCLEATVVVGAAPNVVIDDIIDTCGDCDGSITLTSTTGVCTWVITDDFGDTEFGDGITITFDELCAGVYTIEAIDINPPNCRTTLNFEIIENEDSWHKTTENTMGMESGNDVVTDANDNVYVVGTYHHITELDGGANPNIVLNPGSPSPDGCMFLAKYDPCGTLLWAARSSNSSKCTGNSLTLDESSGMVYVTGDHRQDALFHSSESEDMLCDSGTTIPLSSSVDVGYIAQYDMETGCLYFVEKIVIGDVVNCRTITTNETTGEIFVGGRYLPNYTLVNNYAFIHKYNPEVLFETGNTLGLATTTIIDDEMVSYSWNQVNDLDYDENNNRLYAIGTFKLLLNLTNGTTDIMIDGFMNGNSEAFLLTYDELDPSPFYDLRSGNSFQGAYMTGEGVSVSPDNGAVFLTGSYKLQSIDSEPIMYAYQPFWFPVDLPLVYFDNDGDASDTENDPWATYMMSVNLTGGSLPWARHTMIMSSSINEAIGMDVVYKNGNAAFLNNFTGFGLSISTGGGFGESWPYIGSAAGNSHVGVVSYTTSGIRNWINVTQSTWTGGDDDHKGESITADNSGHFFMTGGYKDELSYALGTPTSGDLIKTGSGIRNAFVIRIQQEVLGEFRSSENKEDNYAQLTKNELIIVPNPTLGSFKVIIDSINTVNEFQVNLFDATGRSVYSKFHQNDINIEIEHLPNGIYILQCLINNEVRTATVLKTNH